MTFSLAIEEPAQQHPESSRRSPSKLHAARLAQNGHFHLAGIRQTRLDRLRDVAAKLGGFGIVKLPAVDQDPDLTAGLDRVCLIDAHESQGKRFELF